MVSRNRRIAYITAACAFSLLMISNGFSQPAQVVKKDTAAAAVKQLKPQTTCPIMGGEINKKLFVDYKGKRIYVCCSGCLDQVKKDPEAAIKKLESMGQEPEIIAEAKPGKPEGKKTGVSDAATKETKKPAPAIKTTETVKDSAAAPKK
jgi:YHS domain-containing protein